MMKQWTLFEFYLSCLIFILISHSTKGFTASRGWHTLTLARSNVESNDWTNHGILGPRYIIKRKRRHQSWSSWHHRHATLKENDSETITKKAKALQSRGVYSRPSSAIERGSGFYVPGLEGSRVRGIFGLIVIILTVVNRNVQLGPPVPVTSDVYAYTAFPQKFSEWLACSFGLILLLQALVEVGKEVGFGANSTARQFVNSSKGETSDAIATGNRSADGVEVDCFASAMLTEESIDVLRWMSASFLSLSPGTHFILASEKHGTQSTPETAGVVFSLGDFSSFDIGEGNAETDRRAAVLTALDVVHESRSGRVSVPSTHPVAAMLPEGYRRCIVLQRLNIKWSDTRSDRAVMVIGSNKLLQSFSKGDLSWLGSLAQYAQLKVRLTP